MNPFLEEIAQLRAEIDYLKAENATLKEALHPNSVAISLRYHLTGQQAAILTILADGFVHTRETLTDRVGMRDPETTNGIRVQMMRLRRKITPLKIHNLWGRGYALEGDSLSAVRAIIAGGTA